MSTRFVVRQTQRIILKSILTSLCTFYRIGTAVTGNHASKTR